MSKHALPSELDAVLASVVRLWAGSGLGLGEIVDRLENLAARHRLMLDEPGVLARAESKPRGERARPRDDEMRRLREAGFTVEEIARKFGCPPSTVHHRLDEKKGRMGKLGEITYSAGDGIA